MENNSTNIRGFALVCDETGVVQEILKDDLGITSETTINNLFLTLIDPENRSKAMRFLADIQSDRVAFNYQMNVWVNHELKTFTFIGISLEDNVFIIGAGNQAEAIEFTNFLQEINNEQANYIRQLVKEKTELEEQNKKHPNLTLNDVTELNNELINLQRELSRKNAELERLNETKNRFLGMAAHDLRNPLSIIQGYSQYLSEKTRGVLPEKHHKFIQSIYTTSQFMLNLIEDLLDVSKIESGKLELKREVFDIARFMTKNTELNQTLAEKKNISLHLKCKPPRIMINGDKQKIEQVINNLLHNAIKFSYPKTRIDVNLFLTDGMVQVSIKDQGKGIPAERQETLFQPFQTESSIGTDGEKGTGLGLAIAKRIIEEHNGKIWFDSQPKKGSVFYFTLPYESSRAKGQTSVAYNWENKKILLIEDEQSNRMFIEKVLEPTGAQLISCADGLEGIKQYHNHPDIDVILLDLNLPGKSGFDIIREIRQENKTIPVVVQTAYAWSGDKEKAIVIGSSDYYTKPIDKESFLNILKNFLGE